MSKVYFILFFVFLIVSITPASAMQLSDSKNYTMDSISNLEKANKEIGRYCVNLTDTTRKMDDQIGYIGDNYWKPWKLGKVMEKIIGMVPKIYEINVIIYNLKESHSKLDKDINTISQEVKSQTETNAKKDAELMAESLKNHLDTNFNVVEAGMLKNGDLVQFKSQDKYYRYLSYVNNTEMGLFLKAKTTKILHYLMIKSQTQLNIN